MNDTPTPGRIVRMTLPDSHSLAGYVFPAIVASVLTTGDNPVINLCAFTPTPDTFESVTFAAEPTRGSWHWPERGDDAAEYTLFVPADTTAEANQELEDAAAEASSNPLAHPDYDLATSVAENLDPSEEISDEEFEQRTFDAGEDLSPSSEEPQTAHRDIG